MESKYVHILKSQLVFRGFLSRVSVFIPAEMSGTFEAVLYFLYLYILLRRRSSEHADTTVGWEVSAESVHVDSAETNLAMICGYSQGYFGLVLYSVVKAWNLTQNQAKAPRGH